LNPKGRTFEKFGPEREGGGGDDEDEGKSNKCGEAISPIVQ
jgi:hypothetical protein